MTGAWTLAAKDFKLLFRDPRSAVILLLMPLAFVFVLGLAVGEGFGQKPDERLRISVVNLDEGLPDDMPAEMKAFPGRRWSEALIDDLAQTADIRIEILPSREAAEALVRDSQRSAVLVFEPEFSKRMHACSFLSKTSPPELPPINPLYRDGIDVRALGLTILRDPTQRVAGSIIEQVAQVSMLRVVIPWMIGKAFDTLGSFVQKQVSRLFDRYNFTAKTWAGLTRAETVPKPKGNSVYEAGPPPSGFLQRGAARYAILVPSYSVMFAFFLVLTAGWLFAAERRHNTLTRLRMAPISRLDILLGKLIPCMTVSVFQGAFLLLAGRAIFGMSLGAEPWYLLAVLICTSIAASGLAMLVAVLAKTEAQVAVYGTLVVLTLAGVSGSLMPRDLMPETMKQVSRVTPHAWALDAYSQLLANPEPNISTVVTGCGVLVLFGLGFLGLAWLASRKT